MSSSLLIGSTVSDFSKAVFSSSTDEPVPERWERNRLASFRAKQCDRVGKACLLLKVCFEFRLRLDQVDWTVKDLDRRARPISYIRTHIDDFSGTKKTRKIAKAAPHRGHPAPKFRFIIRGGHDTLGDALHQSHLRVSF